MTGPVRITVHYDQSLRPSGRGRANREARVAYDDTLSRLGPHLLGCVRNRVNDVEKKAGTPAWTRGENITVDQQPYLAPARFPKTLFVEIQLNSDGPYRAASDHLRIVIVGDILSWLGYYPQVAFYLEVNLVFVPMSGMRVAFNKRELLASWGEDEEPYIGSQIPSM